MNRKSIEQSKRVLSLVLSVVLTLLCVLCLRNSKVVEPADNFLLIENRHPGYMNWLHNKSFDIDTDGDKQDDVSIYPVSKVYKNEISDADYQFYLNDYTRNGLRRVVYFLDGTGIDVEKNLYGKIDTDSWNVVDGQTANWSSINYDPKPLNEVTDIYEYLKKLQNCSFIISAEDDAYTHWNKTLQQLLENIGLSGGFMFRNSYIAVVDNGEKVYEKVTDSQDEYKNIFQGHMLFVKSSGREYGSISEIVIDGIDYSKKGRGLNIVVLKNGNIVDSVNFDTWDWSLECFR